MTTKVTETKEVSTKVKQPAPLVTTAERTVRAIIPQDIEQVYRFATAVIRGKAAPKSYGDNPDSITVGILHGMEIGLTPMAALQSIAVINGMPTIWGDGALALVRASGLLEDISETIEGEEEKRTATCLLRRVGQKSAIKRTFSMADAHLAGLAGKQGPWTQYPQRMLQMRARAWALRDGFADVLRGLGVSEEAQDLVEAADGSFVPAGRPLRAHYNEQAEKKRAEALVGTQAGESKEEADEDAAYAGPWKYSFINWDGEIEEGMHSGKYCDRIEAAMTEAKDSAVLEGIWESNLAGIEALLTDPDEQTRDWHKALQETYAARQAALQIAAQAAPVVTSAGTVQLLDAAGKPLGEPHKVSRPFFMALRSLVAKAADRQAAIEINRAGAEHWCRNSETARKAWTEIQTMAEKETAA